MKKFAFIIALALVYSTAFAQEDISRIISHYNTATEDYTPESTADSDTVFADLIGFEWAHQSVYALSRDGIVSGRCEGVFAPGDNVKIRVSDGEIAATVGNTAADTGMAADSVTPD